jgi:hypothetical protein
LNHPRPRISERRKHQRIELPPGSLLSFSPIAASVEQLAEGEGLVLDLSQGGCLVSSETKVEIAKPYSVILQIPGLPQPLSIESAIARWTSDDTFGIMFIGMQKEQEQFLLAYLKSLRSQAA